MKLPPIGLNPWKFTSDGYIYREDGYVGIGVSSPTERLDVDGFVKADSPVLREHVATKGYVDDQIDTNIAEIESNQELDDQRWIDATQQLQDIRDALDGYGSGVSDFTQENFTMSIDPTIGTDPDAYGFVSNQAQSNAWGPFATMGGAAKALPPNVLHRVIFSLSTGTHTITDGNIFGDLSRFQMGWNNPLVSNSATSGDLTGGYGHIAIKSASGYVAASGTGTYTVLSANSDNSQLTLTADPGFSDNQYRGYYIRVLTGTAPSSTFHDVKAIRNHSGAVFNISGRFNGTVTTFEIVSPAAILNLDSLTFAKILLPKNYVNSLAKGALVLEEVDFIRTSTNLAIFTDSGSLFLAGCRFFRAGIFSGASIISINNAVLDGQDVTSFPITVSGGKLNSTSSESSWIIRSGAAGGIFATSTSVYSCNLFLFKGCIDDNSGPGITLQGNAAYFINSTLFRGSGNTTYGIDVQQGARWQFRITDFIGVSEHFTGDSGDMLIDGVSISYDDVNNEDDKTIIGSKGSITSGF